MDGRLVAVLASGEGTTTEALIRAGAEGEISCEVGLVIASKQSAGVLNRVTRLNKEYGCGVVATCVDRSRYPPFSGERLRRGDQTARESGAIEQLLVAGDFALVVLMGYLKRVSPSLVHRFGWRPEYTSVYQAQMLNIHPGPLPETKGMYGIGVQDHVLQRRLPYAAHVVHVVAEEYDEGMIVVEHRTAVRPSDTAATLSARVQSMQREQVPRDLATFIDERRRYLEGQRIDEPSREASVTQVVAPR